MDPIVWWIIGAVVLLLLIWLIVRSMGSRRAELHREEAAEIRTGAQEHDRDFRERQAQADEADAQARRAQAEADEANARARQLEAEAERRGESADEVRSVRDEHLQRADALDPDVETDKDGNRVGTRAADTAVGAGATGVTGAGGATGTSGYAAAREDAARNSERGEVTAEDARTASGDRDGDGDVGLDDRVENTADSSLGHDDPRRNDLGDGQDDATWDGDERGFGDKLRDKVDDVRGNHDVDGDGHRG
ncbi:MAG: hypothetical protein ABIP45_00970 [Knoellia sp.]